MAGRKRKKTTNMRDRYLAHISLNESLLELNWLVETFDAKSASSGRTLSLICSRIREELRIYDPNDTLKYPSLLPLNREQPDKKLYWANYLSYDEEWFPGIRNIRFSPNLLAPLISKYEHINIGTQLSREIWQSQIIFVKENDTNKKVEKYSRDTILKTIRNDLGAHFLSDVGNMYSNLIFATSPGLGFTGFEGSSANRITVFENYPHQSLIRNIAAELQILLRSISRIALEEKIEDTHQRQIRCQEGKPTFSITVGPYSKDKVREIEAEIMDALAKK